MVPSWEVDHINHRYSEKLRASERLRRARKRGTRTTWLHEPVLRSIGAALCLARRKLKGRGRPTSAENFLRLPGHAAKE